MFKFEKSITINKTPDEVFDYVANPGNMPQWRYDVIETKFKSLPLKAGDKLEEIVDFNGRKTCVIEVVDLIPGYKVVFESISGTTYLPRRVLTVEKEGGHSKLTIKVSANSDGFSRFIEPLSLKMYSIKWDHYLFSLKNAIEHNDKALSV